MFYVWFASCESDIDVKARTEIYTFIFLNSCRNEPFMEMLIVAKVVDVSCYFHAGN